ncbi:hypothetical protein BO83DRAFT_441640 [Aspergillus eucalypticola CBS 122712]|uniref:Uncharacterized protein n=1 Tax=Aspergillus eucalypticola (strain CBS 122712 / IBT 29274) TaxID=1448314 RepID=A0A317UN12_ASPEC|nr:uncharacterized protein BO83DRAFT_441640 [Aspergillus eucalypticola CBS 122712]PWY63091.1 hypothetical protein BO83DRAFT_441640 [Aspergillus eucalypticola CBS 122712]
MEYAPTQLALSFHRDMSFSHFIVDYLKHDAPPTSNISYCRPDTFHERKWCYPHHSGQP